MDEDEILEREAPRVERFAKNLARRAGSIPAAKLLVCTGVGVIRLTLGNERAVQFLRDVASDCERAEALAPSTRKH